MVLKTILPNADNNNIVDGYENETQDSEMWYESWLYSHSSPSHT